MIDTGGGLLPLLLAIPIFVGSVTAPEGPQ
jgi:hypothetical protein